MGDREPIKDLLFLLGADALVFEQEVEKGRLMEESGSERRAIRKQTDLGLLEAGVHARFEVPEVAKDALFKFFHVSYRATKGLWREGVESVTVGGNQVIRVAPRSEKREHGRYRCQ